MSLGRASRKIDWSDVLFFSCVAFLIGVFIFSFLDWSEVMIFVFGFILVGSLLFLFFFKNKRLILLFFVFLFLIMGIWMVENEKEKIKKNREIGKISGNFIVTEIPERKDDYQKVIGCFDTKNTKVKSLKTFRCTEKILIFGSSSEIFEFGDVLEMDCEIKNPENKYPKFNYTRFLAKDDIYQICSRAKIIERDNIFSNQGKINLSLNKLELFKLKFFNFIFNVRGKFENQIKKNFQEPGAGYLAGLLLGGEDRLPEDVSEDFRRTGTTHTVAVSGYNITIIAAFLMWFGIIIGFWRQKAFWLAVLGIIFFIFMIGAPSSAVRAAVMGILILWAAKNGKLANSWRAIVFAAFLMVIFSPFILVYDVGFQLSFLATLSLVFLYAPLSEKFEIQNDFLEIKSIVLMTIVAQLGVLGVIIYNFESISLLSIFANLIILPLIPIIMLGGFVVILVSFIAPFLANFLAMPVQSLLDLEIWAVSVLAQFKWASVNFENISVWWLVGYYLFFVGLILKYRGTKNVNK